jgi:alanine-glyoxylate transaminase/serine-glyoxylate transaminase/serine-pyruvate transaminase
LVLEEGLEARWQRHADAGAFLVTALESAGFAPVPEPGYRLPQLTAVRVPAGIDEAAARRILLTDHKIEIGAGLGAFAGEVWRIGLMGAGARKEYALRLIQALGSVIARQGPA